MKVNRLLRRQCFLLLVGLGSFVLSCLLYRLLLRPVVEGDSLLSWKVDSLLEVHEPPDLLFVGSSYTYRGVIPSILDAELAEGGVPLRSYTLAAPGAYTFEVNHYLDQLLEHQTPRLRPRFVVLELFTIARPYIMEVMGPNRLTTRSVEYHDPATTAANLSVLLAAPLDRKKRLLAAADHLLHLGYNLANVGLLPAGWNRVSPRVEDRQTLLERRGYNPELKGKRAHAEGFKYPAYRKFLTAFRQRVFATEAGSAERAVPATAELDYWSHRTKYLESLGVRVLFLIPALPYPDQLPYWEACRRLPLFAGRCLNLSDPQRFAELFRFDNRYDPGHLNHRGAKLNSKRLAAALLGWFENSGATTDIAAEENTTPWKLLEDSDPVITSWYGSVREQTYAMPGRLAASPGPVEQPTLIQFRDIRLGPQGRIRFSHGVRDSEFPLGDGVKFTIDSDRDRIYERTLVPGKSESRADGVIEIPHLAGKAVHLILRTDCIGTPDHDEAWWQDVVLE